MSSAEKQGSESDTPEINNHFGSARDARNNHTYANRNEAKPLEVKTYDIHDILRGAGTTPLRVGDLIWLVANQARLHGCDSVRDESTLADYMMKHGSTFRGFVLHAEGKTPVAYALYYQTVDEKGKKVAYCEDFFINESFRNQGVAKILFQELASRTINDGCSYLQWATDGRNQQVIDFVTRKLEAKTPEQIGKITISASELLDKEHRQHLFSHVRGEHKKSPYETRPITPNDLPDLYKVGLGPEIINETGALPFKGYITHLKNKPSEVLAITPGWIHFSTFQLKEGLHLEHPSFAQGLSDDVKTDVMLSVLETSATFRKRNQSVPHNNHVRWHIFQNDAFMTDLLQNKLGLGVDTMTDDPSSRLHVFQLENGHLHKIATETPKREVYDRTVFPYHPQHAPSNRAAPEPLTS